ncbi:hypothetical protein A9Z42_0051410 [Trichoderma parareesei]|uniref:Uncharacterized protein n=1 Tax=Trichoderma parareesei TaxID=858221 RepID=A0A2H2ZBA6_TRIPA|nr:hypothetical protein A9Z42_0051410 [Trichoderma parareesei]
MYRLDTSMETHRLTHLARHYSYECKASAQERPYVSRPSRSQQLRNPKLVPKLTSDTPNPLEKKKGVADEELGKLEAERERKRKLEEREDELRLQGLSVPITKAKNQVSYAAQATGIQSRYHATVHLLRVRALSDARGGDTEILLLAEETIPHPLDDSISVMRSQNDGMVGGGIGEIRVRDRHSRRAGLIEAETITTPRAAVIEAVVMEGRDGHRPERHPVRLTKRRPESEA